MEIEAIFELVGTVAFPIAMCLLEAWYIKYMTDNNSKYLEKFRQALDNNTAVISLLNERLDKELDGEDR